MIAIVRNKLFIISIFCLTALSIASPAAGQQQLNREHAVGTDSVYEVKQGDTFYSLSRRFSIPVDSLQNWNGTELQAGQTLYLYRTSSRQATAGKEVAKAKAPATGSFPPVTSTTASATPNPKTAAYKTKSRIMVIPFDPYLYFSDADDEIAAHSHVSRPEVRYAFRGRLDALLKPQGYETIHMLGDIYRDSVNELRTVYKTLHYSYQDNKSSRYNPQPVVQVKKKETPLEWAMRQKEKLNISAPESEAVNVAQDASKHYGVEVKDSTFFDYFNTVYAVDYYVFINQFEVKTNYENCLDRAAWNYERDFFVHYSIYNSKGELVSGNKIKVPYQSNINDLQRIVKDNVPSMAKRVLADLPPAQK
ncbi:LysM peptidoglycan-binding domain-containing protein [Botryobacter ruber]|uniref:LysM peptidoglycan-binding domain-containing protein n=1 Tax=Botryobacter ruber TaxID=2171629 RepID=UPI000E0BFCB3|nr:LysM peptidoglycan-binding domain-containing protein [Botryobacter ruber]